MLPMVTVWVTSLKPDGPAGGEAVAVGVGEAVAVGVGEAVVVGVRVDGAAALGVRAGVPASATTPLPIASRDVGTPSSAGTSSRDSPNIVAARQATAAIWNCHLLGMRCRGLCIIGVVPQPAGGEPGLVASLGPPARCDLVAPCACPVNVSPGTPRPGGPQRAG